MDKYNSPTFHGHSSCRAIQCHAIDQTLFTELSPTEEKQSNHIVITTISSTYTPSPGHHLSSPSLLGVICYPCTLVECSFIILFTEKSPLISLKQLLFDNLLTVVRFNQGLWAREFRPSSLSQYSKAMTH